MTEFPPWNDLKPEDPQYAVELVQRLLVHALDRHATDIHLQPRQSNWEVLFRMDGVLVEVASLPRSDSTDPVARLMILANLPSYRASEPQEGRLTGTPGGAQMRLGTFPTVHGVRAVVRLLDNQLPTGSLNTLSLPVDVADDLRSLCRAREGLVLMAGPAGAGKTTTLYACLHQIAMERPRRSVLTIEDPIEAEIESISQSQLQPAAGMTLAAALKSAVRQDPEVLLVSEIRDAETAEAVLSAALTGHLCFSSIHASRSVSVFQRLVQMNLPPYLIGSGVLAVVSQRLLRRICDRCRPQSSILADPRCDRCLGVGYCGRVVVAECIRFDEGAVGEAVIAGLQQACSIQHLHALAIQAGMIDMPTRAWRLVDDAITDAAEVYRVLGRQATESAASS